MVHLPNGNQILDTKLCTKFQISNDVSYNVAVTSYDVNFRGHYLEFSITKQDTKSFGIQF